MIKSAYAAGVKAALEKLAAGITTAAVGAADPFKVKMTKSVSNLKDLGTGNTNKLLGPKRSQVQVASGVKEPPP